MVAFVPGTIWSRMLEFHLHFSWSSNVICLLLALDVNVSNGFIQSKVSPNKKFGKGILFKMIYSSLLQSTEDAASYKKK